MRKAITAALAAVVVGGLSACVPAEANLNQDFIVAGVEADDMLKLRAGPGTGFRVLSGLPNGTVLRLASCQQTGGTRWCKVSLKQSRSMTGYVSWAYLRPA